MVSDAVAACVRRERWDRAFELILRFGRDDLVEAALATAYMPLIRSGHTGTLAAFATKVRVAPTFPPAVVDWRKLISRLPTGRSSSPRESLSAPSNDSAKGTSLRREPRRSSRRARTRGLGSPMPRRRTSAHMRPPRRKTIGSPRFEDGHFHPLQGEVPVPPWVMEQLEERREQSPLDLTRHAILELTRRHFTTGYADSRSLIGEAEAVLHQVDDPRARSAFAYVAAYVDGARNPLPRSEALAETLRRGHLRIRSRLRPAAPLWNHAHVALGLRKFGHAERMLQRLEDAIDDHPSTITC